jgi:tRNA(Ile)-lysidine synthase
MLKSFQSHISKQKIFSQKVKILLTVSGGVDSVLMCELFYLAKINFGIAHCNFQLRGDESNGDEAFVRALAKKYKVEFHTIKFNTTAFAKKNKLSTQIAARQLRYEWFEKLRTEHHYHFIATAHHQDDSIETFFINIVRGTSISGLHGILPKQGNIIRPMLFTNKEQILEYVKTHKLKYREDSSNASDKYVRNKIRHQIIPLLKELNPGFEKTMENNILHLCDVETIYKNDIDNKRKAVVKKQTNGYTISIPSLKKLNPIATYLFEFLKPFNFNQTAVDDIIAALDGESGKQFFSETHRLIKDREFLIVEVRSQKLEVRSRKILVKKNETKIEIQNLILNFKSEIQSRLLSGPKSEIFKLNSIAQMDFDKLTFPLEIRKWEKGDVFYPLGMKGQKKLSDFFIDKKLSISQKENIWLLTSAGKIVWVIGLRMDDRFKITDSTKKNYTVELL